MKQLAQKYGFLAIWCDIGADDLEDYRNWLTREHIADRTNSPGFLGVRLFTSLDDEKSHFILYATVSRTVFQGPAYLSILNNPSPWTQRIMPRFGPFDRAAGEQIIKLGNGFGAFVAVSRISAGDRDLDQGALQQSLSRFMEMKGVVSVRLFAVDKPATDIRSQEKTMRTGAEGDFRYLLCIETTSEVAVRNAAAVVPGWLPDVFDGLTRHDISLRKVIYGEACHEAATLPQATPRA